jgi:glutamyl-tRNA synthetase
VPKYAHVSQVMKLDEEDGNKRKISKRKDPEAAVSYFFEAGFPKESILEYLLTLINSNFEDWRRANPTLDIYSFPFNLKKMSPSGCLFDLVKLNDISKNVISVMKAETVYELVSEWAQKYDEDFYKVFTKDKAFSTEMVNIDRESPKPRKDIAKWEEVKEYFSYMFNEYYVSNFELPENIKMEDAKAILTEYIKVYDTNDDKDIWFNKIKELCEPLGFTPNVKEYKQNPESFKGHVGDVSTVIRLAVTGRKNTPDLYSIMKLLGKDEVVKRLSSI